MRLLIIGNINSEIKTAIDIAKSRKAKVVMVESCEQGVDFLCQGKGADLVLVDVQFDIKSLTSAMKNEKISTPVIAYGVQCTPKEAVLAIKSGAKEFLPLPPDERLIAAIFAALSDDSVSIIGDSSPMLAAVAVADKIAKSDANVLITGGSGTGKEVFSNYIHSKSGRKDKQFVAVNCAAIPENLLESELFGHEKGAFTGALSRRIGKFEESSGGTLLLDEISEMDFRLQAKLLRAIQEKEIDRVGGNSPVKVDLRIIATSNRDLHKEIEKGNFREDLYFRLNIINIELPSLSEREGDLSLLSEYFIKKYVDSNGLEAKSLSNEALDKMMAYSWPGNVRELENILHRAVLMSESAKISAEDIQIRERSTNNTDDSASPMGAEKQMLFNTLGYCLGDMSKAASILGVSIQILKEKLEKYTK
ncbi:MAG: sigma-54 dependent transcriptional regulator [Rickettsiaceae bacterium]|nr:sigma-54 dependent transcriptional regulator [Rickettsiaceae bacterium]MDP4832140.1 sigma-54 dependent transcriptional regulator [Rickettsiaceae bacterium]MDP5020336.1 sigma-54 dependent transcriptional regulator [Rickettsiaceae bacterium]MDP5082828.1 sigma-54 dependent transcriptional regulator [Rickettsiaceae bacterium]